MSSEPLGSSGSIGATLACWSEREMGPVREVGREEGVDADEGWEYAGLETDLLPPK